MAAKDQAQTDRPETLDDPSVNAAHDEMTRLLDDAASNMPPVEDEAWAQLKRWVRVEIQLALAGESEETRADINP